MKDYKGSQAGLERWPNRKKPEDLGTNTQNPDKASSMHLCAHSTPTARWELDTGKSLEDLATASLVFTMAEREKE